MSIVFYTVQVPILTFVLCEKKFKYEYHGWDNVCLYFSHLYRSPM